MDRLTLQQFMAWLEERGYTVCSWSYGYGGEGTYEQVDLPSPALIEQFLRQQQGNGQSLYPSAGFDYQIESGDFRIPAGKVATALSILNQVYGERKGTLEEWFETAGVQLVTNAATLDVIGLRLDMERSRETVVLFHQLTCIASCVASHSWLRFVNDDGVVWSYVFDGDAMREV
jgi:hypothetical protein